MLTYMKCIQDFNLVTIIVNKRTRKMLKDTVSIDVQGFFDNTINIHSKGIVFESKLE